ncbi:hypothetical protein BGPG180_15050 [Staphylococcus epidermidis]|nr:hypothetical protein [Staphylococcus epidermidis]
MLTGIGLLVGTGLLVSSSRAIIQIKGPLGKDFEKIITETLGEPVTIKE